jgi:hypothetical protein
MQPDNRGAVPNPGHGRPRGGNGKFVPTAQTAERDAEAARMRSRGATFAEIARALGYADPSTASRAIQRALTSVRADGVEELRALEGERLDELQRRAWAILDDPGPVVSEGRVVKGPDGQPLVDAERVLKAIDRLLRISERRCKLFGLDMPSAVRVESTTVMDEEIASMLAALDQQAREDERRRLGGGE